MAEANKNIALETFSENSVIERMPGLAFVFSTKGSLLTWNKNVEIVTGYSKEELDHKFVARLIYEPDRDRALGELMKILSRDEDTEATIEYRVLTKSGKVIPHLLLRCLVAIKDKEYVIGLATDISTLENDNLNSRSVKIDSLKKQLQEYYREIEKINEVKIREEEKIFLNTKRFYQELFNELPGIFYLYEKVGDKFFLKKWNKNYEIDLGYPEGEIYNSEPHRFFTEKEYKKAEKAINQIFTSGSVRVEIYTTHKNGKQIPYFYEGYILEDSGRTFFMGVGIDVSLQHELKKQQQQQRKEKKEAQVLFDANKRELVATALYISKTNKTIIATHKQIDSLLKKHKDTNVSEDLFALKRGLKLLSSEQNNWETFRLQFTEVHKYFFNRLLAKHPKLTKTEIKFCAYLRIHLSSSQISSILNVSNEAIRKSRYRIRKKLNLMPKDSLEAYIAKF